MQTIVRTMLILAASLLITGAIWAIGQTEAGNMEGGRRGPGGRVDFHAAAEQLGISEEELRAAIDGSLPNSSTASETLGIPAAEIEAAMLPRGERGGHNHGDEGAFSLRSLFGFAETILPIAVIIALFTWVPKGIQAWRQRKAEPT